ncbi:3-hydroxyacyl-CoA dehydrogenase [Ignatzschineria indica]|uniref:3-hydroxyacyl-CoA dehydrogenase n=1 Tax=Ignatzschineria indica TaxID=472583 RepID=UPI0016793A35|nr:3-hydroxyacyl-CoA dehydrogenase [Ignatzschineria indica]GGZ85436.1 3-hydroxyacyl-CoA dehydrogenase [Ignatzschineria indica]
MIQRRFKTVSIVGVGAMGTGIAQITAQAGYDVYLYDQDEGAGQQAKNNLKKIFDSLIERGKITRKDAVEALNKINVVETLKDAAQSDLVIEAIIENLEIKQKLFQKIEKEKRAETILASNTSSLSISAIGSALEQPQNFIGLHFFNPVPLMKVVEIIPGLQTDSELSYVLQQYVKDIGHTPVIAKDTPGFIVNHVGRAYGTESLKILGEGIASVSTIDTILREGLGFRLGPFELFDLTALDVSHPAMESIYSQFYQEPRLRPHTLTKTMLSAGMVGRKAGKGFYEYHNNQKVLEKTEKKQTMPKGVKIPAIWIGAESSDDYKKIFNLLTTIGATIDHGERPERDSLTLLTVWGQDATEASIKFNVKPENSLCIDLMTDLNQQITLMINPSTTSQTIAQYCALFNASPMVMIRDSVGFVAQRVIASIVNLACDIAQQQIASVEDIDLAVKLGLGYPQGPLAWGDKIGPSKILRILEGIYESTHDPRYRVSPWLKRRVILGLSLTNKEQDIV